MKKLIPATLAVAFILTTAGARAQEAPGLPPGPFGPFGPAAQLTPAQQQSTRQIFSQAFARVEQLHRQGRSEMLGVLTPEHRQLLGQVAATLATSPDADLESAARQLDAALSAGEARSIVNISTLLHQQERQVFESAHTQAMNVLTPEQRSQMPQGPPHGALLFKDRAQQQPDPGRILLTMSSPHPELRFFWMRAP